MSDLVVVVADGGIEQTIRGLLSRPEAIGIRSLSGVEIPKLHKLDQGVYATGHEIAKVYATTHTHALLILDFAWEGRPTNDPLEMRENVEKSLRKQWGDNGRCIVIVPELENWIWSDSPHVAKALGWDSMSELKPWLTAHNLWNANDAKPADPKLAYERAIREKRVQKSNATFYELARKVSFKRCADESFNLLLSTLRAWFPPQANHSIVQP